MSSKKKYCRVCGERLTAENRYKPKSGNALGRICYDCYKTQLKTKYKSLKKKFVVTIDRGSNPPFKLRFESLEARRDFSIRRRLQIRWGQCHTDPSGFAGKAVDRFVQYMDPDTQTYRQFYITQKCSAAGCGGTIRYDTNGNKLCDRCGWFYQADRIIELIYSELDKVNQRAADRLDSLPSYSYGDTDFDLDDGHSTYDVFYARAYSKRLPR